MRLPEGESGVRRGNLTEDRIELLAEYWRKTDSERAETPVLEMAKLIGVSAATVRAAKKDKRVRDKIEAWLKEELLYDVVEARSVCRRILRDEKEKGEIRLRAGARIEMLAGNLQGGGVTVNNVQVQPTVYEEMSDEDIKERVKLAAVELLRGRQEPTDVEGGEDSAEQD